MTDANVIQAIKSQLGEAATEEQIDNVLAALRNIQEGDPVGMIRHDAKEGKLAHRVSVIGLTGETLVMWRVSDTDGDQYNDMQPTLTWPVLYEPPKV